MRRREFIVGAGVALVAAPVAARAQAALPVLAFVNASSPELYAPYHAAFL
jgi:hypothetical protein